MAYLLADSFGGLGQQQLGEEQNRRMAMAQAMAAFQHGVESGRAAHQWQQQAAMERNRMFADNLYRMGELANRRAEINRQINNDTIRNDVSKGFLHVQEQALDNQKNQPTPTQERRFQLEFNSAANDASQGRFENPDHVQSLYPTLTEPEANVMATRSLDARRGIMADHDVATRAADTLNKWNVLSRNVSAAKNSQTQAHVGYVPWNTAGETQAADKLKAAQDELARVTPIASRIQSDKRLSALVSYDPDSDAYVPTVPVYPWMTPKNPQAPVGNAPAGPAPTRTGAAPAPSAIQMPTQPQGTSTGSTSAGPRKYNDSVYQRVNELVAKFGMDPITARQRAVQEDAALFGQP